ncbi:hypothetical protein ECC02_005504 [Trypanosoma cruzi]|uniref:C2H2-type domain-containing protein n=1 Tax=Trypanosoma cruzi TaxID=5693 RepID=A0A7J6Y418_TRYCR|nr:hypothetical protein ECC02_005504 [Trypanosoma cruzi]
MTRRWDASPGPAVRVTGDSTRMISSDLLCPSEESAQRQRRYVAPGHAIPDGAGQVGSQNQQPHFCQSCPRPVTQNLAPPAPHVAPSTGRHQDPPHDHRSHSRGNHGVEENRRHICIRMFLPPSFPDTNARGEKKNRELRSWRDLPANPLNGLPGLATQVVPVDREECNFYCDACQKGFFSQERYDGHMMDHVWCTMPGCRFTCLKGKEWKMEMHMETLHNRPDAPNLADVGAYLSQRRQRFPTQDAVKSKVEELFYKASRGVIIPDERRRWLRQHGVLVKKNPRTEETYIDSDALRRPANAATNKAVEGHQGQKEQQQQQQQQQQNDEESGEEEENTEMNVPPVSIKNPHEEGITVNENPAMAAPNPSAHGRPKRIIPLGPNGTLTRGQKVQLIRDRYRDAKTVPRFYVCHRCGEKGNHWVDECPKRDDENFGRQTVWGEERLEPARQKHRTEGEKEEEKAKTKNINENEGQMEDIPSPPGGGGGNTKGSTTAFCEGKDLAEDDGALELVEDDADPPAESSARKDDATGDSTNPTTEVSRILAPVAAAALTKKKGKAQQMGSSRSRTRPPPPPTLYERLVESRKANEQGLLLQAFRFFVMRRFFEPL